MSWADDGPSESNHTLDKDGGMTKSSVTVDLLDLFGKVFYTVVLTAITIVLIEQSRAHSWSASDWADKVNGSFELFGGLVCWRNCVALYRDKAVLGVDWYVTVFWVAFGLWNMFYYPHLHQWASFAGGILVLASNLFWVLLVMRYKRL